MQSPQSQKASQAAQAAQSAQNGDPLSEQILSKMEGSVAEAKQAIETAIQLSSQTDSGLLSQILEKVSYIELRMDSAESKATDMLRHLSQHLSEFSLSMAQGDVSILRGWILSLKSGFLKSVLSLGISEDQAVEAFQVLIKMTEEKVKLETENDEMFSLWNLRCGAGLTAGVGLHAARFRKTNSNFSGIMRLLIWFVVLCNFIMRTMGTNTVHAGLEKELGQPQSGVMTLGVAYPWLRTQVSVSGTSDGNAQPPHPEQTPGAVRHLIDLSSPGGSMGGEGPSGHRPSHGAQRQLTVEIES